MKKILALISLSIFAAQLLVAAEEKTAAAAPRVKQPPQAPAGNATSKPAQEMPPGDSKSKAGDESASIALKNKSSFNIDPATRSPFWPIGWKPTGKVATGGTDQGEVPPGAFLVSTITVDGATKFAIINGKSMSEGQQFGLQIGTQIYQVSVKRIEDGRVILGRRDEEIVVPLRRK
ncbi:MAG TPA: hypothetical protein VH170_01030 [Chthoniobacterales bacterium]|jgi:hypothetical protein|nr:hypothetical protein [Chthoniobacterales bacterium]